jgi:hypothetical protein
VDLIWTALAVAFVVGIIDSRGWRLWALLRPLGALGATAVLLDWPSLHSLRDVLVALLGVTFAGLALPAILDAAVSRPTQLTRQRPRL